MIELLRSNDIVILSLADSILREAGVGFFVADSFASAVDGSLGIIPRRLMVAEDDANQARRLLTEAGLGHELSQG